MANHAEMTIDGKKSDLKYLNYRFHRHTEDNGKPATRIRKGEITVTKDSIYDKGSMVTWLSDPDKGKDGEIVIYQDEAKKKPLKTLKFTNGYIISYEETFNLEGGTSNTLETCSSVCAGGSVNLATLVTNTGGGTLSFHATQADAQNDANPLASSTVSPASATNYYVRSEITSNGATCYSVQEITVTIKAANCGAATVTATN